MNRNYVRPELRDIAYETAKDLNDKFPGSTLGYLDANFPFINKFPLLPHWSHNDGKKLDLAFLYNKPETKDYHNGSASWLGYGVCEEPRKGEQDTPAECGRKYWHYNLLRYITPQGNKTQYIFDEGRTRYLVMQFAQKPAIGKVFIEPHLKTRLNLTHDKIRFHGCHAVRHDDHIHVQLK